MTKIKRLEPEIKERTVEGSQDQPRNHKIKKISKMVGFRPVKQKSVGWNYNKDNPCVVKEKEAQSDGLTKTSTEEASSRNTSLENSKVDSDSVGAPDYYLPKIVEALFSKAVDCPKNKRILTHFNLMRKCFSKILKLRKYRVKSTVEYPRQARKTLVLDLDETLVHTFKSPQPFETTTIYIDFGDGTEKTVYMKKRPGCIEFLEQMSQVYDIFIFTASHACYADQVIDILDPHNKLIKGRYFNDSCIKVRGYYMKSLEIFKINKKDIVIVDNMVLSFGLNLENGIPIKCYIGDDEADRELIDLAPFLLYLNTYDDIRKGIMSYFKWESFMKYHKEAKLLVSYYF